jgi:hypothetical protein
MSTWISGDLAWDQCLLCSFGPLWVAKPYLYPHDIMQKDICLGSTNKMIFGTQLRINNKCQVGLQQLGKTKLWLENGSMGIFYNLFHFVPTFCPTQGYPLRFLALTHHICATSRMLHQSPIRMHPSTCSWFYSSDPLCASKIVTTHFCKLWFYTMYYRCKPKITYLSFFSFELPFLSSSNSFLLPLPLHAWSTLDHPSSAATWFT